MNHNNHVKDTTHTQTQSVSNINYDWCPFCTDTSKIINLILSVEHTDVKICNIMKFCFYILLWSTEFKMIHSIERSYTGSSKKMDGIWNRYNLKSTGWIYMFGVLKCSEKFKVLDLP